MAADCISTMLASLMLAWGMPRHLLLPHAPTFHLSCPCEYKCYCAVSFRAHRRDLLPAANFKKDSFPSKKDSSPVARHRPCLKRIWKRIPPGRVDSRKRMLAGRVVMRKRMETNIPSHYAGALTNQYPSASGGLFRRGRCGVEVRQVQKVGYVLGVLHHVVGINNKDGAGQKPRLLYQDAVVRAKSRVVTICG